MPVWRYIVLIVSTPSLETKSLWRSEPSSTVCQFPIDDVGQCRRIRWGWWHETIHCSVFRVVGTRLFSRWLYCSKRKMAFHMRKRMFGLMVWLEPNERKKYEWKKEKRGEVKLNAHAPYEPPNVSIEIFHSFGKALNCIEFTAICASRWPIVFGTLVSLQPNERKHLFSCIFISRLACAAKNEYNNKQQTKIVQILLLKLI